MMLNKGLFTVLLCFGGVAIQAENEAVDYNDFLICWQDLLEEELLLLAEYINAQEEELAYRQIDSVKKTIYRAQNCIRERAPYAEAYQLKQAALDWWLFYKNVFQHDYPLIVELAFREQELAAANKQLKGLLKNLQVTEQVATYDFKIAQKQFALKHDLYLE